MLAAIISGLYEGHLIVLAPAAAVVRPSLRPVRTAAPQSSAAAEELYRMTANNLSIRDLTTGTGQTVAVGNVVTIKFTGELLSQRTRYVGVGLREQPFQSGERRETFAIGGGRAALWEEAVQGMRVGGQRLVLVPPSATLAPAQRGAPLAVPEGETVRYTCEICAIETGALALCVRAGLLGVGTVGAPFAFVALLNLLGLYLIFGLATDGSGGVPPASAAETRCAPKRLLASRAQLDLAVQAASVQAWEDAAEVARELQPESLAAALEACAAPPAAQRDVVRRVEALSATLTTLGERGTAASDEAMRAMNDGTTARAALDDFLRSRGFSDGF